MPEAPRVLEPCPRCRSLVRSYPPAFLRRSDLGCSLLLLGGPRERGRPPDGQRITPANIEEHPYTWIRNPSSCEQGFRGAPIGRSPDSIRASRCQNTDGRPRAGTSGTLPVPALLASVAARGHSECMIPALLIAVGTFAFTFAAFLNVARATNRRLKAEQQVGRALRLMLAAQ